MERPSDAPNTVSVCDNAVPSPLTLVTTDEDEEAEAEEEGGGGGGGGLAIPTSHLPNS